MNQFFSSPLSNPQWLLFALVPPAIVALYFLKLRRQPLEVPSTYLWRRTIEDMHVNSLWQRLRQNLLLFLQLLLIGLLMLACLRPSWRSQSAYQDRLIFLLDNSASMSATDVEPNRLEAAKKKIDDLIEQMDHGDAAMLISFNDSPYVNQPFTTNKGALRKALASVEPTSRTSDVGEALRIAAGLANPGRSGEASDGDAAAADAKPADVFVLSDGGFRSVPEFSWGNLRPIYVPIGEATAANLAIVAFQSQGNPAKPDQMEAFVEVENFSENDQEVELSLSLDDNLLDASKITIAAGKMQGTSFSFNQIESGTLKIELEIDDDLAADNVAYAAINPGRRAKVLMMTDGNDAMEMAFGTSSAAKLAEVTMMATADIASDDYQKIASEGSHDLIIYDRCSPDELPRCNTLFLASVPPGDRWVQEEEAIGPIIIDVDSSHPLMKYLAFGDVQIARSQPVDGPQGAQILMDSDAGALMMIAPREGFEDAVLGFPIMTTDDDGSAAANTTWPRRTSFPLFCKNLLEYLGNSGGASQQLNVLPGAVVPLRFDEAGDTISVTSPIGATTKISRNRNNAYIYTQTSHVGIYDVNLDKEKVASRFAVNLMDPIESRIVPQEVFETAWNKIEGEEQFKPSRRDAWRWILFFALIVLIAEWYIYNRRVYL